MAATAAVLSDYSVEVITQVTDARRGLPSETTFLPAPAEVKKACEVARKALIPKPVEPKHGEVVTEKNIHQHPSLLAQHSGKVFVLDDSPEWRAWASYTSEHRQRPFNRGFWGGWTFPTRWPPGWPASVRVKIKQTAQADNTTT